MKLYQIVEILNASVLTGNDHLHRDISNCGASDLMSEILSSLSEHSLLLTGLTTVQTIRTALIAGIGAVVFVRGKTPHVDTVEMARNEGLPLLATDLTLFASCGKLYGNGMRGLDGTI
jgi:predicted transcriptional regulator